MRIIQIINPTHVLAFAVVDGDIQYEQDEYGSVLPTMNEIMYRADVDEYNLDKAWGMCQGFIHGFNEHKENYL